LCIVDDDRSTLEVLRGYCAGLRDIALALIGSSSEALYRVQAGWVDVLVTDLEMPDVSGLELLDEVKAESSEVPVLIMTAHATVQRAVDLLQRGADDVLEKPLGRAVFVERLSQLLERVRRHRRIARSSPDPLARLRGRSPAMVRLRRRVARLARTGAPVLIQGPMGAAVETVARALHDASDRAHGPFHALDVPAVDGRTGLEALRAAEGGTLFLDAVDEVAPAEQLRWAPLLRAQEPDRPNPDGPAEAPRVVAGTRRDPAGSHLHPELRHRFLTTVVRVPPLSERREDIRELAEGFLLAANRRYGRARRLTDAGLRWLELRAWSGDQQELARVIDAAAAGGDGPLGPAELGEGPASAPTPAPAGGTFKAEKAAVLARFEQDYLSRLLRDTGGHLTRAAEQAGMDRKNLWQLMKRHGLDARDFRT
jgi:two-component system response regulator AtoC